MYVLRRTSGPDLALTEAHEALVQPRRGSIHWSFDASVYTATQLQDAAALWRNRAVQEMFSLALFTELSSKLHLLGAPLDWSGAMARVIADEVRHTDICLRVTELLEAGSTHEPVTIDDAALHLLPGLSPRGHIRFMVLAAFCIGETLSGRLFRRILRVTDVPLAREAMTAIVVDETFHGELGWELLALLMRRDGPQFDAERTQLATALPRLFAHYATLCLAREGPRACAAAEHVPAGPNFATLTESGYGHEFWLGMREDVVPGLVAVGLPEAEAALDALVQEREAAQVDAFSK